MAVLLRELLISMVDMTRAGWLSLENSLIHICFAGIPLSSTEQFPAAIEKLKDQLLENNEKTKWVPAFVKENRFHNWLENVSRSRFWGTPLPIWISEDGVAIQIIGRVKELGTLSGMKESYMQWLLAEDGKNMSKRSKNYPFPKEIIHDYGAVSSSNN
ncbi:hypothetical protein L2E82_25612 [Cichorium intybus]|uniref:Uncharacterized protein n=1 Tax=Cichorium intybus TaxID=13427 RepID=A0ACB9E450_CICIN|nr:hypothetical protein L2E82_25612 [Cichorium intybus]